MGRRLVEADGGARDERAADDEQLVLADGFSCREQISYLAGRMPQHLGELLAEALADATGPSRGRGSRDA